MLRKLLALICIGLIPLPELPGQIPLGGITGSNTTSAWVLVQRKSWDKNSLGSGGGTCVTSGTQCVVNVTAIGAHHSLVVKMGIGNTGVTFSSISEFTSTDCAACLETTGSVIDLRYVADTGSGGATTITCNTSGIPSAYMGCEVYEFAPPANTTVTLDTGNAANVTSCSTTCAGLSLTLCGGSCTGTPDLVVQFSSPNLGFASAISSPYTIGCNGNGASSCSGDGSGYVLNVSTASSAPNWTIDQTQNVQESAIALKATANGGGGLTFVSKAFAQSTAQQTVVTTSTSINCSTANLIVVALAYQVTTTQTITDNSSPSNTYTLALQNNLGAMALNLYYVYAPTVSSTMTFTATSGGSGDYDAIAVACFSGAVSTPLDQTSDAQCCTVSTGGSYAPGNVTTGSVELLITAIGDGSNSTNDTVPSGYTLTNQGLESDGVASGLSMAYQIQSSSGSSNPSWTVGAQSAAIASGSVSIITLK